MIESDAVEENPFGIPSGVSALRVSNQMGFFSLLFFPEGNESPGLRFADEKTDEDFHQKCPSLPRHHPLQFHRSDICSAKGFEKSRKYFTELPFPPFLIVRRIPELRYY